MTGEGRAVVRKRDEGGASAVGRYARRGDLSGSDSERLTEGRCEEVSWGAARRP